MATKQEMAYNLRMSSMTNSEAASIIGCKTSQVPTFAKAHRDRNNLPTWPSRESSNVLMVRDSGAETAKNAVAGAELAVTVLNLVKAKRYIKEAMGIADESVITLLKEIEDMLA